MKIDMGRYNKSTMPVNAEKYFYCPPWVGMYIFNLLCFTTGDCSTSTMWDNDRWPIFKENILPLEPTFTIADYIYFLYPKTKIVAILRNPITR